MKQKNLAMLGVAVGCGLVAAVAVAKLSAGGSKAPETARVLVAKKDLPLQTKLEEAKLDDMLMWADMPKNLVPPDAATDIEQVKNMELNRTLKQGNPVSISDVSQGKHIVLPDGFKAITLKASQVDAAGGFAKPGARVDIMYVEKTSTGKARAAIILKDMLVLAVGMVHTLDEKTQAAIPQVENVTLAVTDKQATLVALADERGKMKLVLRDKNKPDGDKPLTGSEEIEWINDPFEASKQAAVPPPAGPKFESVVQARKSVPQNTLINADNVKEFFVAVEVKTAPAGVYTNVDDLKGKFIVKDLDAGQTLFKSLTEDKAVEVAKPDPKNPKVTPTVAEPKKFNRFETVIQEAGQAKRIIWLEIGPDKWKRFDTEKEAADYKPAANSKEAAPKGEDPKVTSGE